MPPILFATQTAVSRAPQLNSERLVNCFVERQPQSSKSQAPLFGAPGLEQFSLGASGATRGAWNFNGVAYFVQGDELVSYDEVGTPTVRATGIIGSPFPIAMSDNGTQLFIRSDGAGYIYTTAGGLVQITDPAYYNGKTVTFMDGYFVLDRAGTNEWFISNLYDGLSYNALDFATAEAQPGEVIGTIQNLQLLFVFCTAHIELWYDAGTGDFPFQRYAGGVINYGCISPFTILRQDGAVFFLGADKVFYRLQANNPIRVSTHEIETIIDNTPDTVVAACTTYTTQGHKMVQLDLQYTNTLVFDISTGRWHERDSLQVNEGGNDYTDLNRWRGRVALEIYQKVLIGDFYTPRIGSMSWTTYTEYGDNPILMVAQSATLHKDRKRLIVGRFELDVEAGVGLVSGQGSDPQITMAYSKDGGVTWSAEQPWRSMGKIGEYTRRLRWMKLGVAYQWTFRITISDPVFRTIIQAHADIEEGM